MAAIDELNLESGVIDTYTRALFSAAFWIWYMKNLELTIPVKIWIIRTSVSIRQLHPLFELLFGKDPTVING